MGRIPFEETAARIKKGLVAKAVPSAKTPVFRRFWRFGDAGCVSLSDNALHWPCTALMRMALLFTLRSAMGPGKADFNTEVTKSTESTEKGAKERARTR